MILVAPACWLLVALSHTISPFLLNTGKFHLPVCSVHNCEQMGETLGGWQGAHQVHVNVA